MKRFSSIFLLLALGLLAGAGDKPRVERKTLVAMEKSLDDRVTRLWDDNPFLLLGPTRGIYLEGYGAVFTAEVNLVAAVGITPFHPSYSKPEIDRHRQKKLERMPQLKSALREALAASAASLDTVLPEEQVVIIAFLTRYPWEDAAGIPAQVTLQAPKKKLLDAQRAGVNLEQVIRVTEY
jgi:hypothetical protein